GWGKAIPDDARLAVRLRNGTQESDFGHFQDPRQPDLQPLENAADGPFRTTQLFGDLHSRIILKAEIDHLSFLLIQRSKQVLKLIRKLGCLIRRWSRGGRLEADDAAGLGVRAERLFAIEAALVPQMKADLFPELGEGNGAQKAPKVFRATQL